MEFPISASWLQKLLGTVISDLGSKCNSPKDTKYPTYGAPVSNQTAMMLFNSQSKVLSWVIIIIIKQNFQLWSACNFVYNELCCSNFWYYKILPGNKMVFGCFTSVESFRVLMIVKIKHIYFCGRALNENFFTEMLVCLDRIPDSCTKGLTNFLRICNNLDQKHVSLTSLSTVTCIQYVASVDGQKCESSGCGTVILAMEP